MNSKFVIAMILYAVLGVIAWFVLTGNVRLFILILFAAIALKTYIARKAGW
jgi:hypothetical protein